jgi:hypothetical protein
VNDADRLCRDPAMRWVVGDRAIAGFAASARESQISLTDPDSRAMAAHTHVAVGYNVQIAVDAKHKLIVEQQVTNKVVDGSAGPDRRTMTAAGISAAFAFSRKYR